MKNLPPSLLPLTDNNEITSTPICVAAAHKHRLPTTTGQQAAGPLEGRPDSAASLASREAEKYGDIQADNAHAEKGSATQTEITKPVTDWENYDVTILMNFLSSDRLEMSLDGEQPRSASWKVVSTSPAGCMIEVQTKTEAAKGEAPAADPTIERRQFELLLDEREGACVGFLLTEAGADRLQGALYFQRPGSTDATQ